MIRYGTASAVALVASLTRDARLVALAATFTGFLGSRCEGRVAAAFALRPSPLQFGHP